MSYGMDKTALKKRRELQKRYIPNASDKVGDSLKSEARKAEKQKRDDKYNEYLKLIQKWHNEGNSATSIYIKLKPFMLKEFGIDPKAVIEWKTGEKINIEKPSVNKDDTYDNR